MSIDWHDLLYALRAAGRASNRLPFEGAQEETASSFLRNH